VATEKVPLFGVTFGGFGIYPTYLRKVSVESDL